MHSARDRSRPHRDAAEIIARAVSLFDDEKLNLPLSSKQVDLHPEGSLVEDERRQGILGDQIRERTSHFLAEHRTAPVE